MRSGPLLTLPDFLCWKLLVEYYQNYWLTELYYIDWGKVLNCLLRRDLVDWGGGAWGRGGGGEGLRAEVEAVVMVRKGIAWFIKAQRRDIREAKRGKYTLIVHELEEFISWKLNKKKKATHSKLKCTSGKKVLKKKINKSIGLLFYFLKNNIFVKDVFWIC